MKTVEINTLPGGKAIQIGPGHPLILFAGPCVLESGDLGWQIAWEMKAICERLDISYVFKASYDKANRTSLDSFRGPGLKKGLRQLCRIRQEIRVPVISDVHESSHIDLATECLDVIQIPAFLCRQTDLLVAAAKSGRVVNVKKGQFLSPWDMKYAVDKMRAAGSERILLTERGSCFGYNNLVVDMRSLPVLRSLGCPVIFDATHSVQLPGGLGGSSGGQRKFIPALTRAAMAAGIDGLFMEVHPEPDKALCDGPNSIPLNKVEPLLRQLLEIRKAVSSFTHFSDQGQGNESN
jgi:2-dehydro-3-deoxyphosphooctonate aldolase (KDO 8-P synthase)